MIEGKNFIGFDSSAESNIKVSSFNPATNEKLEDVYYAATSSEVQSAVLKAKNAFKSYAHTSMIERAVFLEEIANEIEGLGDELVQQAIKETGLPEGRFIGERGRTTGQLRMFAQVLRDGNWVEATIDTALPDRKPLPRADIRQFLTAVGPIAVFTASNFPFAFSTAGGDTASALASGCPVIVKAHESHLGVNELVSGAILKAATKCGMPDGVFSSLNGHGYETGSQIVMHPDIKGVAFTGSLNGGMALYKMAQNRDEPIPVFAEMGSINPVIFLSEKLEKETELLAKQYAGSITMGVGQFCTNPGLLLGIKSEALTLFKKTLATMLNDLPAHTMLNKGISDNYNRLKKERMSETAVSALTSQGELNAPGLATVSANDFLKNPSFHNEVFGPFSLLVECSTKAELVKVIASLEGQLTGSIMATENDLNENCEVINELQNRVGRLIFNGAPTGVEVSHAMHHGGPFPAATDSRFTSVGSKAILRFVRPICYQDAPDTFLPDALKNDNPLNLFRLVNGKLSKDKVS